MSSIMIVDDDDLFRESVAQNLSDNGFNVTAFSRGEDAMAHFEDEAGTDLVLLDWKMPGMTGIDVLARMRETGNQTPVIFFTVLNDQIYEEAALTSGAVDFVEKSRSFHILLRRIELILAGTKSGQDGEMSEESSSEEFILGDLDLKTETSRAYWKEQEVGLTLGEFRIVHYLATRAGQDIRYRDLYDQVHDTGFFAGTGPEGYRVNVRTFIKRIRQKFRSLDPKFDAIENYPGFGYRWSNE